MARPIAFIFEFTEEVPGDRIHQTEVRRRLPVRPHPAMRYGAWTDSRPARAPGHAGSIDRRPQDEVEGTSIA